MCRWMSCTPLYHVGLRTVPKLDENSEIDTVLYDFTAETF